MLMNCLECGLFGGTRVDGFGPDRPLAVLVGEAPGTDEARVGRPFVGRSGQLLNRLLADVGIDRNEVYVTNACLCKPPGNRTPTAKELRACHARLLDEITARGPALIVALGKAALYGISGLNLSIKQERGRVFYSDPCGGRPVMATYHPAAVLRSPSLYVDTARDFSYIARIMRRGAIQVSDSRPDYSILTEDAHVVRGIFNIPGAIDRVIIDIETSSTGEILCLGFAIEDDGERQVFVVPREYCPIFQDVFTKWRVSGHNVKFDIQECGSRGLGRPTTDMDTMLLHYLGDERPGHHDLESIAVEHLNVAPWKHVAKKYHHKFENIPADELFEYNAKDVTYTARLINPLIVLLTPRQWQLYNDLLVPASDILAKMETAGIGVDIAYLQELIHKYKLSVDPIKADMFSLVGHEFNPNSYPQVSKVLFEELAIPWVGKYKTDEDTLERISDLHPLPGKLLQYRKVQRYLSTTLAGILNNVDEYGRIHTTFNLHGTVTGRLSSSHPVNLQNIPRGPEARNIFAARPGWTFVEGDLSQAEVRVLAMLSGDANLTSAVNTTDVHRSTAAMMFGVNLTDVTKEQRQAAKHLVFGIVYGMQAKSLGQEIGCSEIEARGLIERYFMAFPVARDWIREIQRQAVNSGYVESPFSRRRRFDFITRDNRGDVERQAVNAPIQSTASDITLYALSYLPYELNNSRCYPVLTVHDSILLETCDEPRDVAGALVHHMQKDYDFYGNVQMRADAKIGTPWGSMTAMEG